MASTTTDDGFHEIQLNGKQLVFLFMAVTVVSVVIFLCGVLVGRGVRLERAGSEPVGAQELAQGTTTPPPPPASASTSTGTPATAGETLTYAQRLNQKEPVKEPLNANSAPAPSPASVAPAPAPAPSSAVSAPAPTVPPPAKGSAKDAKDVKEAAARPATPSPAPAAAEPAGNGYAIQLTALRQRDEADAIAKRLTGKGYPAYVMAPDAGAPSVFRVRVGKFKERSEADAVAARLQKEEQFKPWVVR
jgi:cell division septation protein DedD